MPIMGRTALGRLNSLLHRQGASEAEAKLQG
jgi:hypothetical protein